MQKNKLMKLLILLSILVIIGVFSCSKKVKQPQKEYINKTFIVYPNDNPIEILKENNYKNYDEIREILGNNILKKASNDEIELKIKTKRDSLEILYCNVKTKHAIFEIKKSSADTILFDVKAIKPILKGNNIFQTLTDFGMKAKDIGYYAWKMGEYIDARSINIGDTITVEYHFDTKGNKNFTKLTYKPDKITIHEFYIQPNRDLKYNKIVLPYVLKKRFITGEITKENPSLDKAMAAFGMIPYIRQQVNNAMQAQIAFSSDARIGDKFEVLFEELYVNDEIQQRGKVYYAKYSGKRAGTKYAYRFIDKNEASAFSGMYDKLGRRLISNAVRTPLNNMHITSPFGYRIHPLLGRRRFHKGIDLRGATGTNVYAVSSGRVIKARNNGNGYGKEIRIRHDNGMITQYAHLSRIFVRYGTRVRKGQLIGKVGSTGLSTGPHLHFGVMKNGRWVNPVTNLKMVGANKLRGERLKLFKQQIKNYNKMIAKLQNQSAIIDTIFSQ